MKKIKFETIVFLFFLALIAINIYLSTTYVLNKDLYFNTDIARDFLLFDEITQKKIVLIGPRSSTAGLYHGPLWLYLNYPAYWLSGGNPLSVGWYWIGLIVVFLSTSFLIAKSLFNKTVAVVYALLLSGALVYHAQGFFNPHGALLFLPIYFFTIVKYYQTRKFLYLLAHFFIGGILTNFQLSIGIPLLFLSVICSFFLVFQKRNWLHLLSFLVIPLSLINFLVFELKHRLGIFSTAITYASPPSGHSTGYNINYYLSMISDRFHALTNFQLFGELTINQPTFPLIITNILFWLTITLFIVHYRHKNYQHKDIYNLAVFYYVGFFVLSFVNKGGILIHHFFPMIAIAHLIFASFANSKYQKIFLSLIFVLAIANTFHAFSYLQYQTRTFSGKNEDSWKFLSFATQKVFELGPEKEFGYFVYSPDAFGYEPKYAMKFTASQNPDKKVHELQKKSITYILAAPPPPDIPMMKDEWWRINQVKIAKEPMAKIMFPNGYKIERYELTDEEIKIPFDPNLNIGIHFR